MHLTRLPSTIGPGRIADSAYDVTSLRRRQLRAPREGVTGHAVGGSGQPASSQRNSGALIIRIGFWGLLFFCNFIVRNPQNSIGNSIGPYSKPAGESSLKPGFRGMCAISAHWAKENYREISSTKACDALLCSAPSLITQEVYMVGWWRSALSITPFNVIPFRKGFFRPRCKVWDLILAGLVWLLCVFRKGAPWSPALFVYGACLVFGDPVAPSSVHGMT